MLGNDVSNEELFSHILSDPHKLQEFKKFYHSYQKSKGNISINTSGSAEKVKILQPNKNILNNISAQPSNKSVPKQKFTEFSSKLSVDDFELGPKIGKGKFSSVYIARDKSTNYIVALKVLNKSYLKRRGLIKQLKREIMIQSVSTHKNILQLFGFFHDEKHIYLIMEYASGGDLYSLMKKQPKERFDEKRAALYVKQVCEALIFIHNLNIIHRDIKPENIMISFDNLKLGDFGLAIESEISENSKRKTFCGTLDYISPEMFNRKGHDYRVDVWSVGVLAYELCTGKPPFEGESMKETMKKACTADLTFPDSNLSEALKDLLKKLLVSDPDKRIALQDALKHPWIIQNGY